MAGRGEHFLVWAQSRRGNGAPRSAIASFLRGDDVGATPRGQRRVEKDRRADNSARARQAQRFALQHSNSVSTRVSATHRGLGVGARRARRPVLPAGSPRAPGPRMLPASALPWTGNPRSGLTECTTVDSRSRVRARERQGSSGHEAAAQPQRASALVCLVHVASQRRGGTSGVILSSRKAAAILCLADGGWPRRAGQGGSVLVIARTLPSPRLNSIGMPERRGPAKLATTHRAGRQSRRVR